MRRLRVLAVLLPAVARLAGAEPSAPDFNRDIRPILSENCFRCHGPDAEDRKGGQDGLRLDTRAGATADLGGGAFAIVPGRPDASELVKRLVTTDDEELMPPRKSGKKLSAAEIDTLRRWIAAGAPYARHWAYEPPQRPPVPRVADAAWPRTSVDAFLLARLEREKLRPQPEADRPALARRVALDLTGLPPSLAEVDAFVADRAPDAYERFVDRQLAKPGYGEHWARQWLDLARYADSKGYADDQPRLIWRYRDTVIDAFNRNQPFDRFTVDQLAGDLLPQPTQDQLFATGFHRNTMNNTEGGTDDEEFRVAAVVDRVNTTMAVWMGTSMACAQCHTHKYDPLTHHEYFRLYAIFNQTEDADRSDETPVLEFFTAEQQAQRRAWETELAALDRTFASAAAGPAHRAALEKWIAGFPRNLAWDFAPPAALKSAAGATLAAADDGTITVTPAATAATAPKQNKKKKAAPSAADSAGTAAANAAPAAPGDTTTLTLAPVVAADRPLTALRLETPPQAGAAAGNFVVTRVRVGVVPAAPHRTARYVRIELPGKARTLALAEVEVFSGGKNIAATGRATQVSTDHDGAPALALDGRTDGDFQKSPGAHTAAADDAWWELDLGSPQPLERIVVWGRTGAEQTPTGLRIRALDTDRALVFEQTARTAPKPSLAVSLADPLDVKLARAAADYAQPDFDESLILADAEPKVPNRRKPAATRKGWGVAGAVDRAHALDVQFERPLALQPGEKLVVTLEQRSSVSGATLRRFRLGTTAEPRIAERLRPPADVLALLDAPAAGRDAAATTRLLDHYVREVAPELKTERARLAAARRSLDELAPVTSPIMRELPADKRRKTHVQLRGNHLALGDEVQPGVPAVFPPLPAGAPADRLALARWLVAAENPLTARVLANRLWESIFGLGLVRTAEEFGSQGELPSHPELLDWLAVELVASGWDQKKFLRLLVTSAAYRQSARVTAATLAADPENRLLSRGPRFRLGAELVRDQALAVSGLLSAKTHGPSVRPFQPAFDLKAAFGGALDWKTSTGEDRLRRALYTEWRRSSPYPSMVTFDAPNREVCTVRRSRTNTPLQALVTLNDPVYVEAAQALARLVAHGHAAVEDKVRDGFRRVLLRAPTDAEVAPLAALYRRSRADFERAPDQAAALIANPENPPPATLAAADLAAWTAVANVLLNLDETLMKR